MGLFYFGGELLGVHYFVVGYNTLKGCDIFSILESTIGGEQCSMWVQRLGYKGQCVCKFETLYLSLHNWVCILLRRSCNIALKP